MFYPNLGNAIMITNLRQNNKNFDQCNTSLIIIMILKSQIALSIKSITINSIDH